MKTPWHGNAAVATVATAWLLAVPIFAQEPAAEVAAQDSGAESGASETASGGADTSAIGRWRFSAGPVLRCAASIRCGAGSFSSSWPIPARGRSGVRRGDAVGSAGEYADRNYRDGYVYRDEWTELDGGTSLWGYENPGQVQGDEVTFHGTARTVSEFSRSRQISTHEWIKEPDSEYGWMARAEYAVLRQPQWEAAVQLSLSRVCFSGRGEGSNFREVQNWRTWQVEVEDTYHLPGVGNNSVQIIDNIPLRRSERRRIVSSGTYEAHNAVSESIEMDLSTLSLGVSLSGRWRFLRAGAAAGPTANLAGTDVSFKETLYESMNGAAPGVAGYWEASDSGDEYLFGLYVEAGLSLALSRRVELGVFCRYDWLENVEREAGPARFSVNPEGGAAGATVGFVF